MHRSIGRHVASALVIVAVGALGGSAVALAQESTTQGGITRTILAQAAPQNAPGQHLYLQEVRIAAGTKLPTHFHQGTQVANIRSGVLTYDIVSGTAAVTRANGKAEDVTGPAVIRLRRGDAITETASLVHFGSNKSKKPVVVLLAALLAEGAPLATPTAAGG